MLCSWGKGFHLWMHTVQPTSPFKAWDDWPKAVSLLSLIKIYLDIRGRMGLISAVSWALQVNCLLLSSKYKFDVICVLSFTLERLTNDLYEVDYLRGVTFCGIIHRPGRVLHQWSRKWWRRKLRKGMGELCLGATSEGELGEDGVLGNGGTGRDGGGSVMKGSCSLSWGTSKGGT